MPCWKKRAEFIVLMSITHKIENKRQMIFSFMLGLSVVVFVFSAQTVRAAERLYFDDINIYKKDGLYQLDADTIIRMRNRPTQALEKGVSLYFDLKIELLLQHNWWPDSTVATIDRRFRLFYFELTRHYRVTETHGGESRNFRTLDEALEYLGRIRQVPLIEVKKVRQSSRYRVEMSMGLDKTELPAPLQLQAYTTRRWRMNSNDVVWPLD